MSSLVADAPVVGYSGRISLKKNIDETLRLAEWLIRSELEADAPANVRFHDFLPREDLPDFYAALDAFITASACDTLGLTTLEANACDTPVVAAHVAPFDEMIRLENGARFELNGLDDMERALRDCLDGDRDTWVAVGRFSVRRTIDELESIYGVTA